MGSCLIKYIKTNVKSNKLVCWSDACGGQNRNIKIALIWMYIVDLEECSVDVILELFTVQRLIEQKYFLECSVIMNQVVSLVKSEWTKYT